MSIAFVHFIICMFLQWPKITDNIICKWMYVYTLVHYIFIHSSPNNKMPKRMMIFHAKYSPAHEGHASHELLNLHLNFHGWSWPTHHDTHCPLLVVVVGGDVQPNIGIMRLVVYAVTTRVGESNWKLCPLFFFKRPMPVCFMEGLQPSKSANVGMDTNTTPSRGK